MEASDVVLEVLDARDPLGCRCVQVEQAILDSGSNKKLILLLNKIGEAVSVTCFRGDVHLQWRLFLADLVPKDVVQSWLKHLRNEFPTVAFKASTQTQKHNLVRCFFATYCTCCSVKCIEYR